MTSQYPNNQQDKKEYSFTLTNLVKTIPLSAEDIEYKKNNSYEYSRDTENRVSNYNICKIKSVDYSKDVLCVSYFEYNGNRGILIKSLTKNGKITHTESMFDINHNKISFKITIDNRKVYFYIASSEDNYMTLCYNTEFYLDSFPKDSKLSFGGFDEYDGYASKIDQLKFTIDGDSVEALTYNMHHTTERIAKLFEEEKEGEYEKYEYCLNGQGD